MVARHTAFNAMYTSDKITEEERAVWDERRLEVEVALAEIDSDPEGYLLRILGGQNLQARKQTDRFTQ